MSNYREKPIPPEVQADIEEWIVYGRSTFALSDHSSPAETIKTVGEFIDSWQVERQNGNVVDDPETITDTALSLATLWGDAVCREFGWYWACLEYEGQDLYAVVSPNRALACFPLNDINTLLQDPESDNCAILSFNMIKAGKIPHSEPHQYLTLGFAARHAPG